MIAVVHAGRMGTYHRMVQHTLAVIERRFATPPAQVYAVLEPAIGACCYLLDASAVGPFQTHFSTWEQFFIPYGPERWTMDLLTANTLQLHAAGVPAEHIEIASICTACFKQNLYSHRAERTRRPDGEWPLWRSRLLCIHLSHYRCYSPPLCVILC